MRRTLTHKKKLKVVIDTFREKNGVVESYNFVAINFNGKDLIHVILNKKEGINSVIVAFRKYIHVQDVDLNFTPKKINLCNFSLEIFYYNNCC